MTFLTLTDDQWSVIETELQEKLKDSLKSGSLNDETLKSLNRLNRKLSTLNESGANLQYKKVRLMRELNIVIGVDDEDCECEDDEDPADLFFEVLANQTKLRAVEFMYV